MLLVGYCHACRRSEVLDIVRDHIADGYLTIQRKKHGATTIQPLIAHANPLLDERSALIEYTRALAGFQKLFKIGPKQFWRIMQRHGKVAGIPLFKLHPHALRHTMLTEIYNATKDLAAVQAYAGHVAGSSSMVYIRKTQEQAAEIVRVVLGAL